MSSSLALRMAFEPLRSLAFGGISGTYAKVGTPFAHSEAIIKVQNLTDSQVTISLDGSTDHDTLPAQSFSLYDITANKARADDRALPQNTQVWVKQTSAGPTLGSVYITLLFGTTGY